MLLLVSGALVTLRRHAAHPQLGRLIQPRERASVASVAGFRWAADNAAFSGWDPDAFVAMLHRFRGVPGCLFVAAPDVVQIVGGEPRGDAARTRDRYAQWRPLLAGWPRAYVLQDGEDGSGVPWDDVAAVFVGGSTAYKLGPVARSIVGYAKARGKWAHMGRVNTQERWRYAAAIGCDSADGSGFSKYPDDMIGRWLRWTDRLRRQPALVGLR